MATYKKRKLKKKSVLILFVLIIIIVAGSFSLNLYRNKNNLKILLKGQDFFSQEIKFINELFLPKRWNDLEKKNINLSLDSRYITGKIDKKTNINIDSYDDFSRKYSKYSIDNNEVVKINDRSKTYINFPSINDNIYESISNEFNLELIDKFYKNMEETINEKDIIKEQEKIILDGKETNFVKITLTMNRKNYENMFTKYNFNQIKYFVYIKSDEVVGVGLNIDDENTIYMLNYNGKRSYKYLVKEEEFITINMNEKSLEEVMVFGNVNSSLEFTGNIKRSKDVVELILSYNSDGKNIGMIKYMVKDNKISLTSTLNLSKIKFSINGKGILTNNDMPNYDLGEVIDYQKVDKETKKKIGNIANEIVLGMTAKRECKGEFDTGCIIVK